MSKFSLVVRREWIPGGGFYFISHLHLQLVVYSVSWEMTFFLISYLQLSLSASKLLDLDITSKVKEELD